MCVSFSLPVNKWQLCSQENTITSLNVHKTQNDTQRVIRNLQLVVHLRVLKLKLPIVLSNTMDEYRSLNDLQHYNVNRTQRDIHRMTKNTREREKFHSLVRLPVLITLGTRNRLEFKFIFFFFR